MATEYLCTIAASGGDFTTPNLWEDAIDAAPDITSSAVRVYSHGTVTGVILGYACTGQTTGYVGTVNCITGTQLVATMAVAGNNWANGEEIRRNAANKVTISSAADSVVHVGEVSGEVSTTAEVTFSGMTMSATNKVVLRSIGAAKRSSSSALRYGAAAGRINCTMTSGRAIVISATANACYIDIEDLDVKISGTGNTSNVFECGALSGSNQVNLRRCLFYHTGSPTNIIFTNASSATNIAFENCIAYGGALYGLRNRSGTCSVKYGVWHTTATNSCGIVNDDASATCTAYNCIARGSGSYTAYTQSTGTLTKYSCASNDSSGTSGLTGLTLANQFTDLTGGSEDFRLQTTADVIDLGTTCSVTSDIYGTAIGAGEEDPGVTATEASMPSATGAITLPSVAVAGATTRNVTATGAITLGVVTVAGAEHKAHTSEGEITLGSVTVAGAAEKSTPASGQDVTGAITLGAVTAVGEAIRGVRCESAITLPAITVTGEAKRAISCDGAVAIPAAVVAGVVNRGINCTGAITLGAVSVSGEERRSVTCDGVVTLPSVTVTGVSKRLILCEGSISIPSVTVAGTVARAVVSAGTITVPSATVSGVAEVVPPAGSKTATGAITLGAVTVGGEAHRGINCEAAVTLGAVTVAAQSHRTITCEGAITLGGVTVSAQASKVRLASGEITLPAVTVAGAVHRSVTCDSAVALPAVAVAGQATRVVTAQGEIVLGAITVAAEANLGEEVPNTCMGSLTLGSVSVAGAAHRTIWCEGAITLPAVEVSSGGAEDLFKNKTEQWLMFKWHRPAAQPKVAKHVARMTPSKMYTSKARWGEGTW